uniref:Uncharacterized protein n=1 Tax=Mola mola TaxID=94237 RepID=A0A3Q3VKP5_MOLML
AGRQKWGIYLVNTELFDEAAVVVEEKIILHVIRDVPTSFAMLLCAIYCLNLEYLIKPDQFIVDHSKPLFFTQTLFMFSSV